MAESEKSGSTQDKVSQENLQNEQATYAAAKEALEALDTEEQSPDLSNEQRAEMRDRRMAITAKLTYTQRIDLANERYNSPRKNA